MARRTRSCAVGGRTPRAALAVVRTRRRAAAADESGAVLILALIFVIVGALALVGLVTFAGSALIATSQLKSNRALQYAADGATEIAVQAVRYSPDAYDNPTMSPVTPPQNCLGPNSVTINGYTVSVDCSGQQGQLEAFGKGVFTPTTPTVGSPVTTVLFTGNATYVGWQMKTTPVPATPPTTVVTETNTAHTVTLSANAFATGTFTFTLVPHQQRIVNFYACLATTAPCSATNALVRAKVNFNDVASPGYDCNSTTTTTCGTSMVIEQWVVSKASH